MAEADSALGVFRGSGPGRPEADEEVQQLVDERNAARTARDFARADAIRDQLAEMGVVIEDTPHGTVWHRRR